MQKKLPNMSGPAADTTSDASIAAPTSKVVMSKARWALVAVLLLAFLLPLLITNPSTQNLMILMLMAAQLGVAWNIIGGYAGQISLGHAAFYGIGAYTSSMLFAQFGINPWLGILAGGLIAAMISQVIGWSCFRLKGHYFAMATIAVAEIIQVFYTNWEMAGAAVGITIPMQQEGWSVLVFAGKEPYYYLALGLLLLTLLANFAIEKSFLGYYFRAIKDEPDAARSLGISLSRYKQIAFAVSSFFTAIGGSLYAQKELYIDPGSVLGTGLSIKMSLVAILGGIGTLFGPLVGAAVLTGIEEGTRIIFGGSGRGTDLIIYAGIIIVIAVYYPNGILGFVKSVFSRRKARKAQALQTAADAVAETAAESGAGKGERK
jgi:branched-chain amino acid transport system permease protein